MSAELQRCDLGLWNGSDSYRQNSSAVVDVDKSNVGNINDEQSSQQMSAGIIHNESAALNMLIEQSESMIVGSDQLNEQQEEHHHAHHQESGGVTSRDRPAVSYVNAAHGLFPIPLGRAAKLSQISRVKSKFKFLGKFMAKAVMDSRMVI